MDLIEEGLKKKYIKFENDEKRIIYLGEKKSSNYSNPGFFFEPDEGIL